MSQYRADQFINFDGIQKIQQELGRELGRLFEGEWVNPTASTGESADWIPATDSLQSDTEYRYLIDLPGVSLSDIDVSVHRGELTVKGVRSIDTSVTSMKTERRHGQFKRVIALADDAEESTLSASMNNGVLMISVERSQVAAARPIPVKQVD